MKINQFLSLLILSLLPCLIYIPKVKGQDTLSLKLLTIAQKGNIHEIVPGDSFPDVNNEKVVQYHSNTINLSSFKGRLIIIDFWNTYCSACIGALPKLEALQKKFGDSILIVPVTYQSESSIKQFLSIRKNMGKEINLLSIVEDTLLRQLFPHEADPYEIWIDSSGKIIAITDDYTVSEKNIREILMGKALKAKNKAGFRMVLDPYRPLLINNYGAPDSSFIYRSVITNHIDNLGVQRGIVSNAKITRIYLTNQTIIDLYKFAYGSLNKNYALWMDNDQLDKRVIRDISDSSKLIDRCEVGIRIDRSLFDKNYLYCYDLTLPPEFNKEEALKIMIQDLNRFFKLKSSVKKCKVMCLDLICSSKEKLNKFRLHNDIYEKYKSVEAGKSVSSDHSGITLSNNKLSDLVGLLNTYYRIPYIMNKTNYSDSVSMVLDFENIQLEGIKSELQKHSLDLLPKEYKLDMLVLSDK